MTTHPLDLACALEPLSQGRWRGATTPDYMNMVGPFGGVTVAVLLNAVLQDDRRTDTPVAITTNFCTGTKPGPFEIDVTLERSGKYLQHWTLRQVQGDTVCSTATVVTGRRTDTFSHQAAPMPDVPVAATVPAQAAPPVLHFLQQYEFRFLEGQPRLDKPLETPAQARSRAWMRDAQPRPLDWLSLAALSDGFPLRIMTVRGGLVPMGTVSLSTYFLATQDDLDAQGTAPLLGEADGGRFHAHFQDQKVHFWGTNGTLLASGAQVAWFKQ